MNFIKQTILLIATIFTVGSFSTYAQGKTTVFIIGKTELVGPKFEIDVIKSNYEVEKIVSKNKDDNFYIFIKKQVDNWLNQGYKLIETSSNAVGTSSERIIFVLEKEEY